MPIKNELRRSKVKPTNSRPVFEATKSEYAMAVTTPSHSKTFALFMAGILDSLHAFKPY
jgi:hypothetical protein